MRRRSFVTTIAVLLVALLGVACSSDGDGGPADGESTADGASDQSTDATVDAGESAGSPFLGPEVTDPTGRYVWRARTMGAGGWVTGIEIHPTVDAVYARTDNGGAFRWDPDGRRWVQLIRESTVDLPSEGDYQIESLALAPSDPGRVYVAAGNNLSAPEGSVLRSDDGGATWARPGQDFAVRGNNTNRQGGERLAVDPADADVVWYGTITEGLFVSRDAGVTWTSVRTDTVAGETAEITWVLVSDAGDVYLGVAGIGVLRRPAGESDFSTLWAADGDLPFDAELDALGRLWVVETQQVRRFDPASGEIDRWQPNGGQNYKGIAVDPSAPERAVLTSNRQFWRTTDDGASWTTHGVDLVCDVEWISAVWDGSFVTSSPEIDPHHPNRLWWPVGSGVLVVDGAQLWADDDLDARCELAGIEQLVTNDIVVPHSDRPVVANWDRALFSHASGATTQPSLGPTLRFNSSWDLDVSPMHPDVVVATVADHRNCCRDEESFRSVKSTDGGATWQPFGSYSGDHPFDLRFGNIAISADDPDNIVWLPSFNRQLHFSRDGGDSWQAVVLPNTEDAFDQAGNYIGGSHQRKFLRRHVLAADRVLANTFYLFHQDQGIMRSTDGGETWAVVSAPDALPVGWTEGYFSAHLEADPAQAGHLLFTNGPQDKLDLPFYESRDGGETWVEVPGWAEVRAFGWGAPLADGAPLTRYTAGTYEGLFGLYRSADDGGSWELIATSPADNYNRIQAVAGDPVIPGRVYVGFDGSGVVQGDDPQLGQ